MKEKNDHSYEASKEKSIIQFQKDLSLIQSDVDQIKKACTDLEKERWEERETINALIAGINQLAEETGAEIRLPELSDGQTSEIDVYIDQAICDFSHTDRVFPKLRSEEYVIASLAGIASIVIDVIFFFFSEVVKIYRGGERFDGSLLTAALRKIGKTADGELIPILQWFSDVCKVPYDLSLQKGVMNPNNHRLRSFAHDPFLGLFFAVADILCGTTTCIDEEGRLRVLLSPKEVPEQEKYLAVFYYIGHIISDVCTARGIPVPGFCLTQFFTAGGRDDSLAKIAERMYLDGYDLRHLVSTAVPVAIKNLLIDAYLSLTRTPDNLFLSVAEQERQKLNAKLKREKMLFISDIVGSSGNAVKFLLPPNCGNPCALNLSQWFELIRRSCSMAKEAMRDRTAETVMENRDVLQKNWDLLLSETGLTEV